MIKFRGKDSEEIHTQREMRNTHNVLEGVTEERIREIRKPQREREHTF